MKGNYKLSVCIPNYNRLDKLEKLVRITADIIVRDKLEDDVEICISDDCSQEKPHNLISKIKEQYPMVRIHFECNERNMGMDYNFLQSVLIASGEYCWIVGNDDVPTDNALTDIIKLICSDKYKNLDFIVTPYDSFDYDECLRTVTYPFGNQIVEECLWNTANKEEFHELIMKIERNSALFEFLSNVVFKRSRWIQHGDMFKDKMNTIFIQVYMNMQTLVEGANYLYVPQKIIKNYVDDEINNTFDRSYRIVIGLYDVYSYFLEGEEKKHIMTKVVDLFVSGLLFEMQDEDERRKIICECDSEKIDVLKRYYVRKAERERYFKDKSVIIYGAGKLGLAALEELGNYKTEVIGVCDSDTGKHGKCLGDSTIFGFETLLENCKKEKEIVIVVANYHSVAEIVQKLEKSAITNIAILI